MLWQTEYVAFDGDTGITLRVYHSDEDGWVWQAFDVEGEEFDPTFTPSYEPVNSDTEPEARAAAENWYAAWLTAGEDGEEGEG